jgi:biopolymer transport protein ExbD
MSLPSNREFEHEMIRSPGRRLLHQAPLEMVRKRARGGKGRGVNASLNLTSFIDFLIVVVVFLLMSFSASGEVPTDADLPRAQNTSDMTDAPMVTVNGTQVMVDGVAAGPNRQFPGVVVLQIDKKVPALVVKSVFRTAAEAGYPHVSFMVGRLPSGN